jgi:hypothetical protein
VNKELRNVAAFGRLGWPAHELVEWRADVDGLTRVLILAVS